MPHESSSSGVRAPSRRRFLGVAAGTAATVATAGCLGSLTGTAGSNRVDPVEPAAEREGTPGEFYYFLEENGIAVDELLEDDGELYLTYSSSAETVEESDEEIMIVYEVYKQALIHRGAEIEFLYTEISNPFDGQALGWGIDTEWIHRFDSEGEDEDGDEGSIEDDVDDESTTTDNESATDGVDMDAVNLWSNIMNTKVYEDDLEDDETGNETVGGNESETNSVEDDENDDDSGNETESDGDDS